jgi:peptidoglycan/LPS O-acetylase OafA/YrhL
MAADGLPVAPETETATRAGSLAQTLASNRARLGVVAAALAFYAVFIFRTSFVVGGTRYFVLFEDAMISMRYARHLAGGHGLVWNVGEAPIEGFTNLLWVLWMSVAHKLGLSESKISLFIMLSGAAIMTTTGFVTAKIAKKISTAPWLPLAVLAATLFDYPLVFWTLRGMEVGALTLCVYSLLWLALENEDEFSLPRTFAMGALTSAALLIRSDSVVPIGLISLYGFLTCSKRWVFAAIVGTFAGGTVGAQTVFRKAYFHETLPNTYFLKLFKISTAARVKRGAFVALEVLALHLALPLSILFATVTGIDKKFWRDKTKRRLALLLTMFTAQVGYATYVGGDAWEWMLYANRYMCVGMPALIVLVAIMIEKFLAARPEERAQFAGRLSYALAACGLLLIALNVVAKLRPEQGIAATIVPSKIAFAAGAAMFGVAVLLRAMKDLRDGTAEMLVWFRQQLGSRHTVVRATLLLTALVWLPSHLLPVGRWAAQNAAQYQDEANYTRLGLLIKATTPPDLRMAVAAAGATPYFAERPTEDLLGKNDRYVAKLAPRGVFSPGHDKWDYEYSLGKQSAQLVVEPVDMTDADEAYFTSLGFEKLDNGMRLRKDAPVVRRDVLGREMSDGSVLAGSLAEVGFTLPEGLHGMDLGIVFLFGLVIVGAARGIWKDGESFEKLSPEPPPMPTADDEASQRALKGAEAKAIPTLDGMRGLAVIAVLLFHFAWTFPGDDPVTTSRSFADMLAVRIHAFLWSGWTGVDLFFVLSGYLITRGLVSPSKKVLGTRMKMFWMRRVLRIFPLYYAVLVVGTFITLAFGAQWIPPPSYWLYMQNYSLAFDHEVMRWTAHFWSLAIEEQFYFVWPIVALVVSRRRLIPTILILVLGVVALRAGLVFRGDRIGTLANLYADETAGVQHGIAKFVYRATFTRADGLLLGAFVAVTQREAQHPVSKIWRRLRFPLFVSTLVALVGLYVLANGLNDYDRRIMGVGYVTLALFFASTVSLCADHVIGPRARKFLEWKPLVACGKVSYGMYIFHWPLVCLMVPWMERRQSLMSIGEQIVYCSVAIIAGICFIYGAAWISFEYFEKRFLAMKGKFHD